MGEGIQKRVQPDLVKEIEKYSGGSFSEKLVKWRNDVDTLSQDELKHEVKALLNSTIVNQHNQLEVRR